MPNYDMSDTACRERAEQTKKDDLMVEALYAIKKLCGTNRESITILQKMIEMLKDEVIKHEEEIKCLKQDSSRPSA